jgi:hypothetical protein
MTAKPPQTPRRAKDLGIRGVRSRGQRARALL